MIGSYKILAIIGEAGSGKDTLMQEVLKVNHNLHEIVSFTTRPPREGEKDGINYHLFLVKNLQKSFWQVKCWKLPASMTGFMELVLAHYALIVLILESLIQKELIV